MGKIEKMKKLIECIEKYDFECEAGNLRGCQEWIDLKKEVNDLSAGVMISCVDTTPKNHIERMEDELQELEGKIEKLEFFLEKETEEPKFTDEEQRINLHLQKSYMRKYAEILSCRIHYDTLKTHGEIE